MVVLVINTSSPLSHSILVAGTSLTHGAVTDWPTMNGSRSIVIPLCMNLMIVVHHIVILLHATNHLAPLSLHLYL